MVRVFIFLVCIFFSFLPSFAADDMYSLDLPPNVSFQMPNYNEYKIKQGTSNEVKPPSTKPQAVQKEEKGVKGFFNKLFNKNKKQKPQFDTVEGGYKGTLPSVKSEFGYKQQKASDLKNNGKKAEDFLPEEFQPSKIDDPLFLDVILNKERPSQYIVDMLRIMKFLESFRTIVENHEPVQKFNANVNILDLHARRIERLYSDKPEGMSPSYWLLIDLAYKAKVLGNLKFDANYYSKFSPVIGTQYDPENLMTEDNKLLIDLDKTVFAIRQLNN